MSLTLLFSLDCNYVNLAVVKQLLLICMVNTQTLAALGLSEMSLCALYNHSETTMQIYFDMDVVN